jgi:hypothetical protein
MFLWFVDHYNKMTAEDCKANRQQMAAGWHPAKTFNALILRLFTGAAFAGCTNYTMADRNIINIGLHIIKQYGLYAKEYTVWIACEAITPRIIEMLDTFKLFWAAKIMLVNQGVILASIHGYGLVLNLAGSVFYVTVTFQNSTSV